MTGGIRGRVSWAAVQLQFTDVDGSPDTEHVRRQLTAAGSGSGNLLDYWRDISYGAISLEHSELFGPWRMPYSLANHAAEPLGPSQPPRNAWCRKARELLVEHGVDLLCFHGVIAIVNAHVDGSSNGLDFAASVEGTWGEAGWRYCHNCSALARSSAGAASGRCPVTGGPHDYRYSYEYVLATDPAFPGEGAWRACSRCEVLVYAPDPARPVGSCPAGGNHRVDAAGEYRLRNGLVPWGDQSGWRRCSRCASLIFMDDTPRTVTGCAAGGDHDLLRSAMYAVHWAVRGFSMYFAAHESGHGYGLGHAGRRDDPYGYADRWDVMGYGHTFASAYEVSGPGLAAPNRLLLSWIPLDRVARVEIVPGIDRRITLGPLDTLEGMPVTAVAITGSAVYTVELRRKSGWDRGLSQDFAVLIHEMPSCYVASQQDWRYCGRCHSMNFAGRLKCAGGGIHDVSRSESYTPGLEGTNLGQPGWRWCAKCQGLVLAATVPAPSPCSYGGNHDLSGSGRYVVAQQATPGGLGQTRWRFCHRCRTLTYDRIGGGRSACAAGGVHDFFGSAHYVVPRRTPGQSGWRCCAKCQQLVFMGGGLGRGVALAYPTDHSATTSAPVAATPCIWTVIRTRASPAGIGARSATALSSRRHADAARRGATTTSRLAAAIGFHTSRHAVAARVVGSSASVAADSQSQVRKPGCARRATSMISRAVAST